MGVHESGSTPVSLVYLRARWYHTGLGTFTTRDTFQGVPDRPQSLHRYGYAENRPSMLVDPSGRSVDENGHWTPCTMLPGRADTCTAQDYRDWWDSDSGDHFRRFGWTVGTDLVHGVVFGLPEGIYYLVTDPLGTIVAAIRAPTDMAGNVIGGAVCGDPERLGHGTSAAIFMYMGANKGWQEWADSRGPRSLRNLTDDADKPLRMDADPLRKYGAARLTHPQEFAQALEELRAAGVDIDFRPGSMAYSPQRGGPGRLILDPDASIGALRHELQHFRDARDAGYPGIGPYLQDPALLWDMEVRGYNQELSYARSIGDVAAEKQIIALMERRRLEIFGEP